MALRRTAASLLKAKKGVRRLKACNLLSRLRVTLQAREVKKC